MLYQNIPKRNNSVDMKYEGRIRFYEKIQAEWDRLRSLGIDRGIIMEALSDKYGITKTSIRNNIDMDRMEREARQHVKSLIH